ncbi:MAG: hypothetical protein Q4C91_20950 [Eubacteriales bacterium]|nr:hypothetical protein [Eubacteriales bacterium]
MKRKSVRTRQTIASSLLAAAMVTTSVVSPITAYATDNQLEFKIAGEESIYKGMPLFDGVPEHLDAYLDVLCDYLGTEL